MSFVRLPLTLLAPVAGILALCGCMACVNCRCRDCACIKCFLRCIGWDKFDDFELMVLVHEALFQANGKMSTAVKVTAGSHSQKTDWNTKGVFQQPLHIFVEQGTSAVRIDLLNSGQRVIATLSFKVTKDLLEKKTLAPETIYGMKTKGKGINNPRVKLTLVVGDCGDMEKGLMAGVNPHVDYLVQAQLRKHAYGDEGKSLTETDVLKKACSGPLELFEGLGKTEPVYVAIIGPPVSKRWTMGIFRHIKDYEQQKRPFKEVDVLRIQSVPGDPERKNVFVINYFDDNKVRNKLTFRATNQPRDVWIEMLVRLLTNVHDARKEKKEKKQINPS